MTKKITYEEICKALKVIIAAMKTEEGRKLIAETGIFVEVFEIDNEFGDNPKQKQVI